MIHQAMAQILVRPANPDLVFDVSLVEANGRKASFLRTVSRETGVPVTVINARIDALHGDPTISPDIITARALAPLPKLMALAEPWMTSGATAFFHKGGEYAVSSRNGLTPRAMTW
jgi:16S rRNA G527 N7-methylase RsmG